MLHIILVPLAWTGWAIQSVVNGLHNCLAFLIDVFTFVCIRLLSDAQATFGGVRKGTYRRTPPPALTFDPPHDLDGLVAASNDLMKNAIDRRALVTDKCKILLTLSSTLFAVIGLVLPKVIELDSLTMKVLFSTAVSLLLFTVVLLLAYFGVKADTVLSLDQADADQEGEARKKALVNDLRRCVAAHDDRTDYLVVVYQAARSTTLLALGTIVLLYLGNTFLYSNASTADEVVKRLRADPKLVDYLRGPKGEKGDQGEKGDDGERGEKGDKGERGEAVPKKQ